jgi:hypothetical protein
MELHVIWKVKKTVVKSVHFVARYVMHSASKLVKSFHNMQVEIIMCDCVNCALPQISIYTLNIIKNN